MKDLIKKQNDVIREESGMKINEVISLKDAESGIFDMINDFNNMVKKHPVAKKNAKIKNIMKQLYKLEAQLGDEVTEIDKADYVKIMR
jgi:polyhydroxyalkanoate synthesis regulator phasin